MDPDALPDDWEGNVKGLGLDPEQEKKLRARLAADLGTFPTPLLKKKGQQGEYEDTLSLDAGMVRHSMLRAGEYSGSSCWLYDNDGSAIRDPGHLQRVLTKWPNLYEDNNPHADDFVWVVPADVHH